MTASRPLISVIVPTLNEAGNVDALYERVRGVFDSELADFDWELVVTDNRSTDDTFERLLSISARDERVRAYRFARNFGFQRSIFAGYLLSKGDAVVQLDADLQDPPELIPALIERWQAGASVVYGIRKKRANEKWVLTAARRVFYRLVNRLSEDDLPLDAGDFRLVDRVVVDLLRNTHDASPYLRGTIAALGFEQVGLEYERNDRVEGETKFRLRSLVQLAVDGILNNSTRPLQFAAMMAVLVVLVSVAGILAYLASRWFYGQEWPAGFVTLALLQLVGITLNAAFLGIIGAYLGRMFKQGRHSPVVIIDRATDDAGPGLFTSYSPVGLVPLNAGRIVSNSASDSADSEGSNAGSDPFPTGSLDQSS